MRPASTVSNIGNGGLRYAQASGQIFAAFLALPDHVNIIFREFCGAVRDSAVLATFGNLVSHVDVLIAQKQMRGVHAKAIVAFVQNISPVRYGANEKLPCRAMGARCFKARGSVGESAITASW